MSYNFQTVLVERVHVEATSPTGLDVEFDITLPKVSCSLLNIDANDPSGQSQTLHLDRHHHVWKHRIKVDENSGRILTVGDKRKLEQGSTLLHEEHLEVVLDEMAKNHGLNDVDDDTYEECGSCYGAGDEGECCNTCDDVKRAYNLKGWHIQNPDTIEQCKREKKTQEAEDEGCNVHGVVALDSGGGSFHLAPGRDHQLPSEMTDISALFQMLMRYVYGMFRTFSSVAKSCYAHH